MYGISQNPDTKDYIMVLQDGFCNKCGEGYTDIASKWCKPCQIVNLKTTNLTSGSEKIDNFIQEMQLTIENGKDIVFEWIPYNQFSNIKEIGRGGFATVYSAIWKDGPLEYHDIADNRKLMRKSNKKVILKCFYDSQNSTETFLNEV